MDKPVRVLMITSEWPTAKNPFAVPFLVQQVDFLRRAGVLVEVFSFRGSKNPVNYVKAWWRLRRTYNLGGEEFDVIHAQFGPASLIAWPKRLPLVITFHGTDILGQLSPAGRITMLGRIIVWLGRTAARFADAVIIVSNQMRRNLPSSTPMHLLPTGVDLDSLPAMTREEARRQLQLPVEGHLALFVGKPENPLKRYRRAQEAVEILNRTLPVSLILGWGRPHREIITLMHACDVLVVTSQQEGSPTIVKEALACNLPIASVIVGDVVERLAGIEGCEVVPDRDPKAMADVLGRILRRGERIKGRQAVADLDEKILAGKLVRIYRSMITPENCEAPSDRAIA